MATRPYAALACAVRNGQTCGMIQLAHRPITQARSTSPLSIVKTRASCRSDANHTLGSVTQRSKTSG